MSKKAETFPFYVQNAAFKGRYEAVDYEIAAQMAILDIVEQDNWVFAPFIVVSPEDFPQNPIDELHDINDDMTLMLTYNVINSIAEYVGGEERDAWIELAKQLQESTMAFDGGDRYHDLVRDLM